MKQTVIASVVALCAFAACADKVMNDQEAKFAAREAEEYKQNGGMLKRPNTQKGRIVFLDCQQKANAALVAKCAERLQKELEFGIDVERGTFDIAAPKIVGEATLFIVDDPKLPSVLSAPEDRWAMVNMAKLGANDSGAFESRVTKEISRGMALLGGAFLSQFQMTLTECITSPEQLDKLPSWRLPFDTLQKMKKYLTGYGLQPFEPATYRDACYEGWAPAPKDDIQRAILKEEQDYKAKEKAEAAAKKAK